MLVCKADRYMEKMTASQEGSELMAVVSDLQIGHESSGIEGLRDGLARPF